MSRIKAGDLVMVVRNEPCGCASKHIGLPYIVKEVVRNSAGQCDYCLRHFDNVSFARLTGGFATSLPRLIKIDPPALPETTKRDEEITA